jgi:foldase protein PrsA
MRKRILPSLVAICTVAAIVAGCGGGVPGDAVATVDGNSITKSNYTHWLGIAAKSGGQSATGIPKPPAYKDCIAGKRKTLPKPAKGQPATTDAQLKTQCASEYKALKDQVMQLLISFQWIQGEAKTQGVKVTDAEVKKQFDSQKKASFPKAADYQKFLKQSGQTEKDILMRVKLDLLSNKIRDKVTKSVSKVSDADVAKYYNSNKSRFAQPERRDLLVVLTKTQAKANQAKAAIQSGTAFAKVAKQFSIDPQSKAQGGKLPAVAKGQQDKQFDAAIFKASKNVLTGPVKTQFGFYVFKVTKVTPASQQTQAQASATIKQLLVSQNQQKALDKFVKRFTKKWKAKTNCAKAYETTDCKNGPKPTPTPTVAAPAGAVTVAPTP